jgi:hypothetical protein
MTSSTTIFVTNDVAIPAMVRMSELRMAQRNRAHCGRSSCRNRAIGGRSGAPFSNVVDGARRMRTPVNRSAKSSRSTQRRFGWAGSPTSTRVGVVR